MGKVARPEECFNRPSYGVGSGSLVENILVNDAVFHDHEQVGVVILEKLHVIQRVALDQ